MGIHDLVNNIDTTKPKVMQEIDGVLHAYAYLITDYIYQKKPVQDVMCIHNVFTKTVEVAKEFYNIKSWVPMIKGIYYQVECYNKQQNYFKMVD